MPFKELDELLREPASIHDVLRRLSEMAAEAASTTAQADWENPSLDGFLDAMERWLSAVEKKVGPAPSWRLILLMLEAGKMYE